MKTLEQKHAERAAKLARLDRLQRQFNARTSRKRACVRDITDMDRAIAKLLRMSLPDCPRFPRGAW